MKNTLHPRTSLRGALLTVFEVVALAAVASLFIVPFLWMVSTSLKTSGQAVSFPPSLVPNPATLANYAKVWSQYRLWGYYVNSVIVSALIMAGQMIFVVPAAYAFAVKRFRGRALLFGLVLFGFMVPNEVIFVPVYLLFARLRWTNTYAALSVPFFASAFGTFLFTQAFRQIPHEVLDASGIDGAGDLDKMVRILLPMAVPTAVTFLLFSLIAHWNDYFWVMVMTTTSAVRTIPYAVAGILNSGEARNWTHIMAANVIMMAPMVVAYLFASRPIKTALAYGGIK